jgi:gluconate kinase
MADFASDQLSETPAIFVLFGRPGAGKSTLAAALASVENPLNHRWIDLDVCVTDEMKENFGKGIYPTLDERAVFMEGACSYTRGELEKLTYSQSLIVTFSFVNMDLRIIFREQFPDAVWILVDTTEAASIQRIRQRDGHFYKAPSKGEDSDVSEWKFAPVTFVCKRIDGAQEIEHNAREIVRFIRDGCFKKV